MSWAILAALVCLIGAALMIVVQFACSFGIVWMLFCGKWGAAFALLVGVLMANHYGRIFAESAEELAK